MHSLYMDIEGQQQKKLKSLDEEEKILLEDF